MRGDFLDTNTVEEFEKFYHDWKVEFTDKKDRLMHELKEYANSKVNKISKLSVVIPIDDNFERTSTQKIKRFKYILF